MSNPTDPRLRASEVSRDAATLESVAHELLRQGEQLDGTRHLERALLMRVKAAQVSSSTTNEAQRTKFISECQQAGGKMLILLNELAVQSFKKGNFDAAGHHLSMALRLSETSTENGADFLFESSSRQNDFKATTLNNLGCMERRRGRLGVALQYMRQAQELEQVPTTSTLLNTSAILTQLGRAEEAVEVARKAVESLTTPSNVSLYAGLAPIVHHNLALALEYVDIEAAIKEYEMALELAITLQGEVGSAGQQHPIQTSITSNLERLKKLYEQMLLQQQSLFRSRKNSPIAGDQQQQQNMQPHLPGTGDVSDTPITELTEVSTHSHPNVNYTLHRPRVAAESTTTDDEDDITGSGQVSLTVARVASSQVVDAVGGPASGAPSSNTKKDATTKGKPAAANQPHASLQLQPTKPSGSSSRSGAALRNKQGDIVANDGNMRDDEVERITSAAGALSDGSPILSPSSATKAAGVGFEGGSSSGGNLIEGSSSSKTSKRLQQRSPSDAVSVSPVLPPSTREQSPSLASNGPADHVLTALQNINVGSLPVSRKTHHQQVAEEQKLDELLKEYTSRLGQLLRVEDEYESRYINSRRIQCCVRMFISRRRTERVALARARQVLQTLAREKDACATIVKFLMKLVIKRRTAFAVREAARKRREMIIRKAVMIQCAVRKFLATIRVVRLRKSRAIHMKAVDRFRKAIQRSQARKARDLLKTLRDTGHGISLEQDRKTYAALMVQKVFRKHLAKIAVAILKGDGRSARNMHLHKKKSHAATLIQALFRAFLVRKWSTPLLADKRKRRRNRERMAERQHAASLLQRVARAAKVRSVLRPLYRKFVKETPLAQRSMLEKKKVAAACVIQRAIRCALARRKMLQKKQLFGIAIVRNKAAVGGVVVVGGGEGAHYQQKKEESMPNGCHADRVTVPCN